MRDGTKTDLHLRRASRADMPAIAKIVCDWEAETAWMPDGTTQADIEGMLDAAFDTREIFVVSGPDTQDALQAYVSIDAQSGKIGALYSTVRGTGIGKALVDKAKEGRDFLWLQTHQPNQAAHRFYAREGFVMAGEIAPEAEGEPAQFRMEWRREAAS